MRVDLIMTLLRIQAEKVLDQSKNHTVFERIEYLTYIEKQRIEPDRFQNVYMTVLFIQYSKPHLKRIQKLTAEDLAQMSKSSVYTANSIIKLTGRNPVYLKDRDLGTRGNIDAEQSRDIFNADLNKWMKHFQAR